MDEVMHYCNRILALLFILPLSLTHSLVVFGANAFSEIYNLMVSVEVFSFCLSLSSLVPLMCHRFISVAKRKCELNMVMVESLQLGNIIRIFCTAAHTHTMESERQIYNGVIFKWT